MKNEGPNSGASHRHPNRLLFIFICFVRLITFTARIENNNKCQWCAVAILGTTHRKPNTDSPLAPPHRTTQWKSQNCTKIVFRTTKKMAGLKGTIFIENKSLNSFLQLQILAKISMRLVPLEKTSKCARSIV